jgi:hypothetical protein
MLHHAEQWPLFWYLESPGGKQRKHGEVAGSLLSGSLAPVPPRGFGAFVRAGPDRAGPGRIWPDLAGSGSASRCHALRSGRRSRGGDLAADGNAAMRLERRHATARCSWASSVKVRGGAPRLPRPSRRLGGGAGRVSRCSGCVGTGRAPGRGALRPLRSSGRFRPRHGSGGSGQRDSHSVSDGSRRHGTIPRSVVRDQVRTCSGAAAGNVCPSQHASAEPGAQFTRHGRGCAAGLGGPARAGA